MPPVNNDGISRRKFLELSSTGFLTAGSSLAGLSGLFMGEPVLTQNMDRPTMQLEPNPVLKVLRWMGFVENDEGIWRANTRKWEMETGGRVVTDFINWQDLRPMSAMEAALGAGHDIVFGWFDDPHLYPDKLLDMTEAADYLGSKYGGWYPVCEIYGKDAGTGRWIALPFGASGVCLNYRAGWVREAGYEKIPDDLEGFIKCCRSLKNKGYPTGFSLGHAIGDANSWTHWWLWSFGGKAVQPDGREVCINSPETIQALEAARELCETMTPGVEDWLDPHNNMAFISGLISLTANGNSIYFATMKKAPDIHHDLMTANYPVGPVGRPAELSLFSLGYVFKHTPVPNAT